jgi:hypothetical protein
LKDSVNVPPVGVPVIVIVWTSLALAAVVMRMTSDSRIACGVVMSAITRRAAPRMKLSRAGPSG